jgi:hypothetical protein
MCDIRKLRIAILKHAYGAFHKQKGGKPQEKKQEDNGCTAIPGGPRSSKMAPILLARRWASIVGFHIFGASYSGLAILSLDRKRTETRVDTGRGSSIGVNKHWLADQGPDLDPMFREGNITLREQGLSQPMLDGISAKQITTKRYK